MRFLFSVALAKPTDLFHWQSTVGCLYGREVSRVIKRGPGRPPSNLRLVVWGERREKPDWDTYIAALLSYALREVERKDAYGQRLATVLAQVAEQKYQRWAGGGA
jgi:hypothetical protein